ncbi:unnamed protein product [Alopecurus aequalis]
MMFAANPWAIKRIDKVRRSFLWGFEDGARGGGKCMVNWKRICSPLNVGGLGIKDLKAFNRALRLRWLWIIWGDEERPWDGTEVPCDTIDRDLFAACTQVSLGNGNRCRFWTDSWIDGKSPKSLAPSLFRLARRKQLSVKDALANGRWMKGLCRMESAEQMDQFFYLWSKAKSVTLSTEPDAIKWSLTADGAYSAKSAYEIQFLARTLQPALEQVWRFRAEPKVRFHCWLLLQGRVWTKDRLERRGLTTQSRCPLCDQTTESAPHLSLLCPFAREVWHETRSTHRELAEMTSAATSFDVWWTRVQGYNKCKEERTWASMVAYVLWNIWKERNRRIFEGKAATPAVVAGFAREEFSLFILASKFG